MNLIIGKYNKIIDELSLQKTFDNGICLASMHGSLLDCNPNFLRILERDNIADININDYFYNESDKAVELTKLQSSKIKKRYLLQVKTNNSATKQLVVQIKTVKIDKKQHLLLNIIELDSIENENVDDSAIEKRKKKYFLKVEKLKKFLEQSEEAIHIQSKSKLLFVNSKWTKLTEYSPEESVQLSPLSIIHPDLRQNTHNRFKRYLNSEKIYEIFDSTIITKSAKAILVRVHVSQVMIENDLSLVVTIRNISKKNKTKKLLHNIKNKFRSLFYENNSIMLIVDPVTKNIIDANESAAGFYGYSLKHIKSLTLKDISTFNEDEYMRYIYDTMNTRKMYHITKHRLSDNNIRDVEIYSGIIDVKSTKLLYLIVHDITLRKQAEEALQKSENKLKLLNAQKDRFFSIISHDLRSPVGSVMQLSEFIKENYKTFTDNDFANYFKHIHDASKNTFKLLDNLLTWTRSQLGVLKIKPKELLLKSLIDNTIDIYNEKIKQKNIGIYNNVDKDIKIFVDENTFSTAIRNIISNSIKFTNNNGKIIVDANLNEDELLQIFFKDTGVGIPKDKIDKIFDIQENYTTAGTNNEKGVGLGLIICKELIEKNYGNIKVESQENEGTCFTIEFNKAKL